MEPSPFSHISGMKNRFESLIRGLREAGDEVMVITPDPSPPKEFCGAQVRYLYCTCSIKCTAGESDSRRACFVAWCICTVPSSANSPCRALTPHLATAVTVAPPTLQVVNVLGFKLPFYQSATLLLSLGLSVRVLYYLVRQRPQVIHVSTPGIMCFAAVLYARLLAVPLVMSYHTHIPEYIPRYTWSGLVEPMWAIIRWCTRRADLTLVTSKAMKVSEGPWRWGWTGRNSLQHSPETGPRVRQDAAAVGASAACVVGALSGQLTGWQRPHIRIASATALNIIRFTACMPMLWFTKLAILHCAAPTHPVLQFTAPPAPPPPVHPTQEELEKNRCRSKSIDVWQRGVDTEVFNPRHRSAEMRAIMTDGHVDAPLLVYVGRLGAEKNVEALKDVLQQVGGARVKHGGLEQGGAFWEEVLCMYVGTAWVQQLLLLRTECAARLGRRWVRLVGL